MVEIWQITYKVNLIFAFQSLITDFLHFSYIRIALCFKIVGHIYNALNEFTMGFIFLHLS